MLDGTDDFKYRRRESGRPRRSRAPLKGDAHARLVVCVSPCMSIASVRSGCTDVRLVGLDDEAEVGGADVDALRGGRRGEQPV